MTGHASAVQQDNWEERHLARWMPGRLVALISWAHSDEALVTAAGLAFYALVATPPLVLVGLWIAGGVIGHDTLDHLGRTLTTLVPRGMGAKGFVSRLIQLADTLGWVTVATAVWPATSYGAGLSRAFDQLTPDDNRRHSGLKGRLLGTSLLLVVPVVASATLLLAFLAPGILDAGVLGYVAGACGAAVVGFLAVAGLSALVYSLFAPRDLGWRYTAYGAGVCAGLVTLLSAAYVLYLRLGTGFSQRYATGAAASLVLLGLWLWLVNGALIVGYKSGLSRAEARRG